MDSRLLLDGAGWAGNVASSVLIVFVNKLVMKSFGGYGFHFSTCLSALHYITTTCALWASKRFGLFKSATMPARDLLTFTIVSDLSIISLNLSLMVNTVGFYQISKLMTIPFVCAVEMAYFGRVLSPRVLASILVTVIGVAIVTLEDVRVEVTMIGVAIAAMSVVMSGGQQLMVRSLQQRNKLGASELLSITSPAQALSLALVGPVVDKVTSADWVFGYALSAPAAALIGLSCFLAIAVNATQFACLGRFSALSYQVMGHSKTIIVLLGGAFFLGDTISAKKSLGMGLAVLGMVWYGTASAKDAAAVAKAAAVKSESLLGSESTVTKGSLVASGLGGGMSGGPLGIAPAGTLRAGAALDVPEATIELRGGLKDHAGLARGLSNVVSSTSSPIAQNGYVGGYSPRLGSRIELARGEGAV